MAVVISFSDAEAVFVHSVLMDRIALLEAVVSSGCMSFEERLETEAELSRAKACFLKFAEAV